MGIGDELTELLKDPPRAVVMVLKGLEHAATHAWGGIFSPGIYGCLLWTVWDGLRTRQRVLFLGLGLVLMAAWLFFPYTHRRFMAKRRRDAQEAISACTDLRTIAQHRPNEINDGVGRVERAMLAVRNAYTL